MATRVMASASASASSHLRLVPRASARGRSSASARRRAATRTTMMLLVPTALLVGIGLVMVLSASSVAAYAEYGSSFLFFQRQAIYAGVGILGLLVASRIPYRAWARLATPLLVVTLVLLVLVLHPAVGTIAGGSARWIQLGPVTVQPSELAKLAIVAFAATICARKEKILDDPAHVALPLLPVVLIVGWLVLAQPDFGTTTILAGSVFLVLFAAGVRLRHLAVSAGAGALIAWQLIAGEDYRRARFLAFLSPQNDPQNTGWHLYQSLIALGSGGLSGVGLGASRQKWLYVPNAHTDFIFSILGEELGLFAALAVLALFGVLLYAGIRIAARAPDTFGRLLASGIVGWFGIQIIVNLGAVTGLLPITGVPLPLISYGGSSMVVSLVAVGILANVAGSPAAARPRAGARSRAGRQRR